MRDGNKNFMIECISMARSLNVTALLLALSVVGCSLTTDYIPEVIQREYVILPKLEPLVLRKKQNPIVIDYDDETRVCLTIREYERLSKDLLDILGRKKEQEERILFYESQLQK